MKEQEIPTRPLGRTGARVSALGLGGYHLGDVGTQREAVRIVHAAIDAGLTFMDNAWEYHEGRSVERMGLALKGRREKVFLMTKCCSHGRDKKTAMRQLEQSLRRLKTDHLDLWQIHEVVYDDDPARHYAPGGAVEALQEAKRQGKTRFVGFTATRTRPSTSTCWPAAMPSTPCSCRSTASTPASAPSSGGCCRSCSSAASGSSG
jgi:aryl-alcohol dehydrogenase-like predicted oxidoreductase